MPKHTKKSKASAAATRKGRVQRVVKVRCVFLNMDGDQCRRTATGSRRFFGDQEIHGQMWAQVPCCEKHDRDARE